MKIIKKSRKLCAKVAVLAMVLQLLSPIYSSDLGGANASGYTSSKSLQSLCLPPSLKLVANLPDSDKNTPTTPQNSINQCLLCILCQSISSDWSLIPNVSRTLGGQYYYHRLNVWLDRQSLAQTKYFDRHTARAPPIIF
ncbi:MAG: DUF2946 domain-containing protein [Rhodospirillaceae bacterium]|jgi:hypothetical protein|nr:DUF2946 domain-containing protein [Rhodospirillaceae bacterium]